MHSQMHSQTLQALRGEIEAVTTLQLALNRIALTVDDNSLSVWDGPRPEDVDDVAGDDGSFSREAVTELRAKAGEALSQRYKEVERLILGRAALESLVRNALVTGTGGVISVDGPPPSQVLSALVRSGALRLDWAQVPLRRFARCWRRRRRSRLLRGRRCLRRPLPRRASPGAQ